MLKILSQKFHALYSILQHPDHKPVSKHVKSGIAHLMRANTRFFCFRLCALLPIVCYTTKQILEIRMSQPENAPLETHTAFKPQTQAVVMSCKALHADSLHTYSFEQAHITIGSKDGKKSSPRTIFLETSSKDTVAALKAYGILKGTTPTAMAIAKIGEYRRKLKAQTNYGVQSSSAESKDALCQDAQDQIKALEAKELTVDFTNDTARRAFTQQIMDILNHAINENKITCDSLFQREGRLETHLIQSAVYLEEEFERAFSQRAPEVGKQTVTAGAFFSRADQLYFDEMDGSTPYPIHLTKDSKDHEVIDFLAFHYETSPTDIKTTNNQFRLLGIQGKAKASVFLPERRSFVQRVYHSSKFIPNILWSFVSQPFMDVGRYLKKQGDILLDNAFDPFIHPPAHGKDSIDSTSAAPHFDQTSFAQLEETSDSDEAPDVSTLSKKGDPVTFTETPAPLNTPWLKPTHKIETKDQYDNLIAQLLYITRNNIKRFDTLSKYHEVIALGVTSAGIVTLLVLFKAGLVQGSLKSFIETFFQASKINEFEKVWNTSGFMAYLAKLTSMSTVSLEENLALLETEISDPLKLLEYIASHIAFFTNVLTTTNPALNYAELIQLKKVFGQISKRGVQFKIVNNQPYHESSAAQKKTHTESHRKLTAEEQKAVTQALHHINKQLHYLNQAKKPNSLIGAILVFPLKPIFAVIRPLVSFTAASIASIRYKSRIPLKIAGQEFLDKLKSSSKNLALMAVDFTDTLSKNLYDLLAFSIRTPTKAIFTVLRKTIGTINHVGVGFLNLFLSKPIDPQKTPLKSLNRGLMIAEDFLVNTIGRKLRGIRHAIGSVFKPLRNALHPNSPIERLLAVTKTLAVCQRYFQYQLDFMRAQKGNNTHSVFMQAMIQKIQATAVLTEVMLKLCQVYKKTLKSPFMSSDAKTDQLIELKQQLTAHIQSFNLAMKDIDHDIDEHHLVAHKDLTIAVKFEKQREALNSILETLPEPIVQQTTSMKPDESLAKKTTPRGKPSLKPKPPGGTADA